MLPDQDMKQLFITVNERYITEKDMFGEKCAMLDLKCLQRMSRSDEILHGKDIIGGLLVPFLTLEFDYVRKDMRRRVYAMEDDAFAKVNIIWVGGGGQENLSDEILHGKDIIGGLLVPFLTLEFNYVRKDMRRRVYAMEDDAFAKVNIIWVGGGGGSRKSE